MLIRLPVEFDRGELADKLLVRDPSRHTVVVVEGVLYLTPGEISTLLKQLIETFPAHTLVCELLTKTFIERFMHANTYNQPAALGSEFKMLLDRPEDLFYGMGYQSSISTSVVGRAARLKALTLPGPFAARMLPAMRDGYRVYRFELL